MELFGEWWYRFRWWAARGCSRRWAAVTRGGAASPAARAVVQRGRGASREPTPHCEETTSCRSRFVPE